MKMSEEEIVKSFSELGLSEQKARETLKNANVTNILQKLIAEVKAIILPEGAGMLLYHLATKCKPQINDCLPLITKYIASGKINTTLRVDKAIEYSLSHINNFNENEFNEFCGVGVVVTPEQIEACVESHINAIKDELLEKRYKYNLGQIMQKIRNELPWADGKTVKSEVDVQVFYLLGPKTEADLAPVPKSNKKVKAENKKPESNTAKPKEETTSALTILDVMEKLSFHAPGENYKTDGYVVTSKTMRLMAEHLKNTKGQVRTRFPPEPNGVLHIGHAKAININFGYAKAKDGICILRFDDTNPEKEEERFFTGILDMVSWLGYEPFQITHSSDYFDKLYEQALVLIKKGKAYVCHQTPDEMKGFNPKPSKWRNRSVEDNLTLFHHMKTGKFNEGEATLRMKVTLEEGKVDPVAYRIRYVPHPRAGDKWCIYPTYDFTHCLCDSFENITHSLCTKEFQSRRSAYYWLCNTLEIYCPVQWEYGRLNVNYTVVSKRKIAKLIEQKIVKDWDDPRLFTLAALRRRGFPPESINSFCAQLGVTGAQSVVDPSMLEAFVRDNLNNTAPRVMVVLEPLIVFIDNYSSKFKNEVRVPDFPNEPESNFHVVKFEQIIYIEQSDFMEVGDSGYRRLTTSQPVGLRHTGLIMNVTDVEKDTYGNIFCLHVVCSKVEEAKAKPKAFIHWVSKPIQIDVRLYSPLFNHKNPEDVNEVPGGFLTDCNLNSLKVLKSYVDKSFQTAKVSDRFQFERTGFFCVDPDTTPDRMIVNLTVNLKEDADLSKAHKYCASKENVKFAIKANGPVDSIFIFNIDGQRVTLMFCSISL